MKAIIKENKELILEQNLMLQKENNVEEIDFEFPNTINDYSIEKFRKYIEIETEDKSIVDEIHNDKYILTRAITKYKSIYIQIVLIYEEKDIVFKTIQKNLRFVDSINADEKLEQEEQSLLYEMSKQVSKLENYDDTEIKQNIENIQQEQITQNTKITNLEEDNTINKQNISNLQEDISSVQQDNINHNTRIEDIEENYVKNTDYATNNKERDY